MHFSGHYSLLALNAVLWTLTMIVAQVKDPNVRHITVRTGILALFFFLFVVNVDYEGPLECPCELLYALQPIDIIYAILIRKSVLVVT